MPTNIEAAVGQPEPDSAVQKFVPELNPDLVKRYRHGPSPKVIVLGGHPSAGKSTIAKEIAKRFGYAVLQLDGINAELVSLQKATYSNLNNPALFEEYRSRFDAFLRRERYRDVIVEGCRVVYPHIVEALLEAVRTVYGEYVFFESFFLNTPTEQRYRQYVQKKACYTRDLLNKVAAEKRGSDTTDVRQLIAEAAKTFDTMPDPLPPWFKSITSGEELLGWVRSHEHASAPNVRPEHSAVVEAIANSPTYNPFYQTVSLNGETVISGFSKTNEGWQRIKNLNIDWAGKRVCEVGANNGYYLFRIEELGGVCVGYEICNGCVSNCKVIAQATGSSAQFFVRDICEAEIERFDIVLALSMLHRTVDYDLALNRILDSCETAILEINCCEHQRVISKAAKKGFALTQQAQSRASGFLGPRELLVLNRRVPEPLSPQPPGS